MSPGHGDLPQVGFAEARLLGLAEREAANAVTEFTLRRPLSVGCLEPAMLGHAWPSR
jgi:hypothetical protein